MDSLFQPIVQKLIDLGFYEFFFPWLITAAIFYGLFSKSKILGESHVLNGAISLAIAFLIFGFPVVTGVSISLPLSMFFMQATTIILFLVVGFLFASLFYPDLLSFLPKAFARRSVLWIMIVAGVALFITSTLVTVFTQPLTNKTRQTSPTGEIIPAPPQDVIIIAAGVIIFIVLIVIASAVVSSGGG